MTPEARMASISFSILHNTHRLHRVKDVDLVSIEDHLLANSGDFCDPGDNHTSSRGFLSSIGRDKSTLGALSRTSPPLEEAFTSA